MVALICTVLIACDVIPHGRLLDAGELTVSHSGRLVHKYAAGDSFGESSLLFNRPRS